MAFSSSEQTHSERIEPDTVAKILESQIAFLKIAIGEKFTRDIATVLRKRFRENHFEQKVIYSEELSGFLVKKEELKLPFKKIDSNKISIESGHCMCCRKFKPVTLCFDPYITEIHDELVITWLCADCYQEKIWDT